MDSIGTPIPGATVRMFRSETEEVVASQVAAPSTAAFSFDLGGDTTLRRPYRLVRFWLAAYFETGMTAIFGTSLRTLAAEER